MLGRSRLPTDKSTLQICATSAALLGDFWEATHSGRSYQQRTALLISDEGMGQMHREIPAGAGVERSICRRRPQTPQPRRETPSRRGS